MSIEPIKVNRRRFLRRAAVCTVGGAAAAGYYAWRIEPHWIAVERQTMPLAGLPAELQGKRMVHLSDLHVSKFVNYGHLSRAVEQAAEFDPEVVVVTGDLMTARHTEQVDRVVQLLAKLQPDQRQVFAIPGNHDYGRRQMNVDMANTLFARLEQIGVRDLRNKLVEYRGLQFIGLDEFWARRFRPQVALAHYNASRDAVALTHNPDTVDQPGWDPFRGWILAGHTHGGQCRVPYFGAPILPIENSAYAIGQVAISPRTTLYVNRGLGYLQRVRFMCPPEITVFELTRLA